VLEKCKSAIDKSVKRDWDGAQADVEAAQKSFAEAKNEGELCLTSAAAASKVVPADVKKVIDVIVDRVKGMFKQTGSDDGNGLLSQTIKEVGKKIGQLAKKAQELAGEVEKKVNEAKDFYS